MIWKNSAAVGFGVIKTPDGRYQLVVARYSPAGNYGGQYAANVLPPAPGLFPDAAEEEVFDRGLKDEVAPVTSLGKFIIFIFSSNCSPIS